MIKFLHTRIRVSDLEKSIEFYTQLGFECTRRTDKSPAGNQLAFMELPGNEHFLELTHSPDFKVEFPEDLMHTALGVENLIDYCDKLEKQIGRASCRERAQSPWEDATHVPQQQTTPPAVP